MAKQSQPPKEAAGEKDKKKADKAAASSRLKSKIQETIELAQEEHRKELFRRRIDLARQGVRNYQLKRIGEAVKAFHSYLHILEDWKRVPEGGLNPTFFDIKKDLPELLLINGVYWDLVKLYDRTQSAEKRKEFMHYMEKYIVFSRGMPFQPLSAETLRKYIRNEKPRHKEEFKNAYKMLGGKPCFVVTSLEEFTDEQTLPRMRRFRDEVLSGSKLGRVFVACYYRVGPMVTHGLDRCPRVVRKSVAKAVDWIAQLV